MITSAARSRNKRSSANGARNAPRPLSMAEAKWETPICSCHIVKDCGVACCCQTCLGLPCIFGAAMERAGLGGCFPWCSALNCLPCCTGCNARAKVAEKYGIKEGAPQSCIYGCCCFGCNELQIINHVRFSPLPNHLKSSHLAARCPLSGPAWPTLPASHPIHRTYGHSAHELLSPICPTDSCQRERYVELLRGERFSDWRA